MSNTLHSLQAQVFSSMSLFYPLCCASGWLGETGALYAILLVTLQSIRWVQSILNLDQIHFYTLNLNMCAYYLFHLKINIYDILLIKYIWKRQIDRHPGTHIRDACMFKRHYISLFFSRSIAFLKYVLFYNNCMLIFILTIIKLHYLLYKTVAVLK